MRIMQPQVILAPLDPLTIMRSIEFYGRISYKTEGQMTSDSYDAFLRKRIKEGHESILEHEKVTVVVICDRGVTHEIVRHRIAAYTQESTRYCNYSKEEFGREISVIEPFFFEDSQLLRDMWEDAMGSSEHWYMTMLDNGATAQQARDVLPNSLKTEIAITYNMREWRHFFKLRCAAGAHPQMRQIAIPLLKAFQKMFPCLYSDIEYDTKFPEQHYAEVVYRYLPSMPVEEPYTMSEYQMLASRTDSCKSYGHLSDEGRLQQLIIAAMGMVGEAGEVMEHLKKVVEQGHPLNIDKVIEEVGDGLWYAAKAARICGFDLADVAALNIAKLMKRYPEGFDTVKSINRQG